MTMTRKRIEFCIKVFLVTLILFFFYWAYRVIDMIFLF